MKISDHLKKLDGGDYTPRVLERPNIHNALIYYAWTPTWEGPARSDYGAAAADLSERTCDRCNGSGTIAVSVYFPMNYVGPGPVPDDANGVTERKCDECGGPQMGLKPCPFCGGEARLVEGADGESAFIQCQMVKMHRAIWVDGDNNAANDAAEEWNRRDLRHSGEE